MKLFAWFIFLLISSLCKAQSFDTTLYKAEVDTSRSDNNFFMRDKVWRGADGAAAVDLGKGRILWLFGDGVICKDSSGDRKKSVFIRNSIAIQQGYDLQTAKIQFYWDSIKNEPASFFRRPDTNWLWPGHGILLKDKLLIFLLNEKKIATGLGFETAGWSAVLVSNPGAEPAHWKMKYIEGAETFGTSAGSAAVLTDKNYLYAYGAVEPGSHEVYLLRWRIEDAYAGNLKRPEWWFNGKWKERKTRLPAPEVLFTGATEYSVHYDPALKKYIQVQSFGFGESQIGLRMSDSLQGPWTAPYMFYTPDFTGIKKPFMYSAKAHPELKGSGLYISYNINSFDFDELFANQSIYFPRFISISIKKKE